MAESGLDCSPDAYQEVQSRLLTLHEKAHEGGLDGEGIQAWLEWEMEAMRWRLPTEISRDDLQALVETSEVPR